MGLTDTQPAERGRSVLRLVAALTLGLFFIAMLGLVVALTFSVKVSGHSMEPTIHDGDRLTTNIFGRDHVHRFDIVQTAAGEGGIEVVKRVIGLPGDRVQIVGDPEQPTVLVRPAGQHTTYRVDNPAWIGRTGDRIWSCCTHNGEAVGTAEEPAWVTIPQESYWVLGDNWGGSDDSRVFGFVTHDEISATIAFRILPVGSLGAIPNDVKLVNAQAGQG